MIRHLRLLWRAPAVSVLLLCAVTLIVQPAFAQTTWTWTGDDGADWFDPLNWSPNGTPGSNDTVNVGGNSIYLSSPVTIAGELNWSGGVLTGDSLTIATNGMLNIEGDFYLCDAPSNAGTVNWTGGTLQLDDRFSDYPNASGPIVNMTNGYWNI